MHFVRHTCISYCLARQLSQLQRRGAKRARISRIFATYYGTNGGSKLSKCALVRQKYIRKETKRKKFRFGAKKFPIFWRLFLYTPNNPTNRATILVVIRSSLPATDLPTFLRRHDNIHFIHLILRSLFCGVFCLPQNAYQPHLVALGKS